MTAHPDDPLRRQLDLRRGFAPTSGTVELDGAGATTIAHAVAGGTLAFPTLVISNGIAHDASTTSRSRPRAITIAPDAARSRSSRRPAPPRPSPHRRHRVRRQRRAERRRERRAVDGPADGRDDRRVRRRSPSSARRRQPAKITGEAGGGYALTVNGTIAANHFVVKEMGNAGMVVERRRRRSRRRRTTSGTGPSTSGRARPPARSSSTCGASAPAADFDALAFLNTPGAAGVFNVKTAAVGRADQLHELDAAPSRARRSRTIRTT